jgi:hypothetical protein
MANELAVIGGAPSTEVLPSPQHAEETPTTTAKQSLKGDWVSPLSKYPPPTTYKKQKPEEGSNPATHKPKSFLREIFSRETLRDLCSPGTLLGLLGTAATTALLIVLTNWAIS